MRSLMVEAFEGLHVAVDPYGPHGELEVLAETYEIGGGNFDHCEIALSRILALDLPGVHIRLFRSDYVDGHRSVARCVYSTGDSRRLYQTPMFNRWRNGFSDKWTGDGGAGAADAVFSGHHGWASGGGLVAGRKHETGGWAA